MTQNKSDQVRFDQLGIASNFLAILEKAGYVTPTPIQHQVIPAALEGKDVIGIAQTGTGKTLAYGIPLIQQLAVSRGKGLILVPTRELALQVDDELLKIGRPLGLKTAVLIGGTSSHPQIHKLRQNPQIVIATPGRLIDLLKSKSFSMDRISHIVLDEADRMLDIGFMPQVRQVMKLAPKQRQTMLFSATLSSEIASLAAQFMQLPLRIEVAPAGTPAAHIEQEVFFASKSQKMQLLDKVLTDSPGSVLVFSRTKHGAKKIATAIRAMGHTASEIHSNRSLAQRKAALEGFKTGRFRVLVATDIAARGIDVTGISLVINFDLPDNSEDYVHRIGRTGRAGRNGKAVSFATPDERGDIRKIERLIKKTLPILALPRLPEHRPVPAREFSTQPGGNEQRGGFGRKPYRGSNSRSDSRGRNSSSGSYGSARPQRSDSFRGRNSSSGSGQSRQRRPMSRRP